MNSIKSAYPPLTSDDILTLYGQPVTKRIDSVNNSPAIQIEEWIYYNNRANVKESYVFKNGKLTNYREINIH